MATRRRRSLLRRPAILLVAFASIIALSGVVYAHWFAETHIQGSVNTGNVGAWWWSAFTNDDGHVDDWDVGDDNDGEIFDNWPGGFEPCDPENPDDTPGGENDCSPPASSKDPNAPGATDDTAREDKDVGLCTAWADGGDWLQFDVQNAYPGYTCTVDGTLVGGGNVPMMTAGVVVYPGEFWKQWNCRWVGGGFDPWEGNTGEDEGGWFADFGWGWPDESWNDVEPNGEFDDGEFYLEDVCDEAQMRVSEREPGHLVAGIDAIELNLYLLDSCGEQVDPYYGEGEPSGVGHYQVSVHVKQEADQNANYQLGIHPRLVNWNEYDRSLCEVVFADADG
jgi:hypothetical protein